MILIIQNDIEIVDAVISSEEIIFILKIVLSPYDFVKNCLFIGAHGPVL